MDFIKYRYSGPTEDKPKWLREVRRLYERVLPIFNQDLAFKPYWHRYADGSIIKLQEINHVAKQVIADIIVGKGVKSAQVQKEMFRPREQILIGIEYSDGLVYLPDGSDYYYWEDPAWEYIVGWVDYKGYGVIIGGLGKEFKGSLLDEWETPAFLKSPWQGTVIITPNDPHQGPYFKPRLIRDMTETNTTKFEKKQKIQQLQEVIYAVGSSVRLVTSSDVHGTGPQTDGSDVVYYSPDGNENAYCEWHKVTTTSITLNGVTVIGPFTLEEHHWLHAWHVTPGGIHDAEETIVYTGSIITDLCGVVVDSSKYLILYNYLDYGVASEYRDYAQYTEDLIGSYTTWTHTSTWTGNYHATVIADCSGEQFTVVDITAPFILPYPYRSSDGRCARIFRADKYDTVAGPLNNDGLKIDNMIYLFSFWNPTLYNHDTGEYEEIPYRKYGYVYSGKLHVTISGFPSVGVDVWGDGDLDYDFDHCIIPILPVGMYGTALMRAYKETYTEELHETEEEN